MRNLRSVVSMFAVCGLVLLTGGVCGQDFPNKSIRILTSESGSSSEFTARVIAQGISGPLGQPVIVDARQGGGSVFGEIVAKAAPDGYTLLIIGKSFWTGPLFRKALYDSVKDFAPITVLIDSPNILVVHPSVPVKSVQDLIALAKAKPGQLNYSTSAIGGSPHLAAELFKAMTGVNIVLVPYKGAGSSIIGLVSGEVQLSFASVASVAAQIKSGKVRAVAVTGEKPFSLFPDLPTIAATAPGYEMGGQTGMFAPAKTPAAIINRLNREAVKVLGQPEVKEKFLNVGVEVVGSSPEKLGATVKSDVIKWGKVIKDAGIRLD